MTPRPLLTLLLRLRARGDLEVRRRSAGDASRVGVDLAGDARRFGVFLFGDADRLRAGVVLRLLGLPGGRPRAGDLEAAVFLAAGVLRGDDARLVLGDFGVLGVRLAGDREAVDLARALAYSTMIMMVVATGRLELTITTAIDDG